jgi:subtilisin family serine protease
MGARWRHSPLALLAVVLAIGVSPNSVRAAADAVPGEFIVKYRSGVTPDRRGRVESAIPSLAHVRRFDFIGAEHMRVSAISTEAALAILRASSDVEYAEPNYYVYAQVIPNDPSFSQLWGLKNTGQGGGYVGADIKATQAWDLYTGNPNFLIGVIDTGIDYTHPDLAANIWTNPGEIAGNGRDDDGNGYVDDVHGYDFINHDGDPMDDGYHGTHVAGTIGAVGNNGVGVTGVNWRCKMIAIKFMDPSGVGTEADAIAAIGYSIVVGCRVTNNSWGNMSGGQAMLDAINAAGAAGQLMVFAAGNNGWNIDLVPFYPPSYVAPNMITVTSTDGRDLRPTLTNYGVATVNLGAPGYGIYSCKPGGLYQSLNGTSMAAPHVTGTAALAMGSFPLASSGQIRQLILTSTDPIASMNGTTSTGGRLNAYKVLLNGDAVRPSRVTNLAIADTGSTSLGLAWTAPGDDSTIGTATHYDLRTSPSPIDSTNFAAATPIVLPPPNVAGTAEIAQVSGLAFNTRYHFALRAVDEFGNAGRVSNDVSTTTLGIPAFALSPGSPLALVVIPGGVRDTALVVSNIGQGRLDFRLPAPNPTSWLTATPDSGRAHAGNFVRVGLHLDVAGLAAGDYDAPLLITSNDPATPTATIHVVASVLTAVGDAPRVPFGFRTTSRTPGPRRVALELSLPNGGPVDVSLFDVQGRRVARLVQGTLGAGVHPLKWDGTAEGGGGVGAGIYFARARTRDGASVLRIVIID